MAPEIKRTLELAEKAGAIATFSLDLETGMIEVTPALRALWEILDGGSHFPLSSFLDRIHPEDRDRMVEARDSALRTGEPYHNEYRVLRRDGSIRHIRSDGQFFYDASGHPVRNVGAVLDFTDQRNAQRTIAHLNGHDKLTGLLDRAAFTQCIAEAASAAGAGESFAVVTFDLDRFTTINETFGTTVGDTVLRGVAERLQTIAAPGEHFGRISGDEFAGLLRPENGDANDAVARVATVVAKPIDLGAQRIEIGATFGLSVFPFDSRDEGLLAQATLAMSSLKGRGMSGAQRYGAEMHRALTERNQLRLGLRNALDREEFELAYQPIVDAKSLNICSSEALIRWNHPDLGTVPPSAFLPAAQEIGLMCEVDAWVLRRACRDFADMLRRCGGPPHLGVNGSAAFLLSPDFPDVVQSALAESGIPAEALVFEITEQSLLAERSKALERLVWLHRIGTSIAIDDFGTGYNTLSYLKMYPIDIIKIDRSFVSDLESYPYSRSVCSGILALAAELGLRVVAEGVESKAQEAFLTSIGCSRLQGFLYGKPMPKEDFIRLAIERSEQRAS